MDLVSAGIGSTPAPNLFAGSTEQTCQAAVRRGMPYEKVENCGLLLRSPFYGQPEERRRLSCLRTLKIDSESSFLLLATGANGANRHLEVCRSLAENGKEIQVVALCGKNMVLKKANRFWSKSWLENTRSSSNGR